MELSENRRKYLELLSDQYPTIQIAATEIINLNAILNLPKGTEHFVSDIHGEHEPFLHVLRNCSGVIRRRIDEIFRDTVSEKERRTLCTLIYYPEQKLPRLKSTLKDEKGWYRETLYRLISVCRSISSKYTRSKVRKALPADFAYIIEELLHENEDVDNKQDYYHSIVGTIISTGRADAFIIALCDLIRRLAVDSLHVIGDIFDRGPGPHIILDTLMQYHSVDFQWGNHDILWMAAGSGSVACIANAVRITLRYGNMEMLERGYGISLMPLASFAMDTYRDDPCSGFGIKSGTEFKSRDIELAAKMHKAVTVIQLKLEAQIIKRRPHYEMGERLLLEKIDREKGTVLINGVEHELNDRNFPTVGSADPYELTDCEQHVISELRTSFMSSEKLQRHIDFLYTKGGLYLVRNGNLLYHGCISVNDDGSFRNLKIDGTEYGGKKLLDRCDMLARHGRFSKDASQKQYGLDAMWYMWSGAHSPLFGKDKMATFETYFIDDKSTHKEEKNPYYRLREDESLCRHILEEFGLDPETAHIINGHVPVKVRKGESPLKAGGRLIVIDGGFSKAYQSVTGIAGYTLIYNSHGLLLASHDPFVSTEKAIDDELDIHSATEILETNRKRVKVLNTDTGKKIRGKITDLELLVEAFRKGIIKERQ